MEFLLTGFGLCFGLFALAGLAEKMAIKLDRSRR